MSKPVFDEDSVRMSEFAASSIEEALQRIRLGTLCLRMPMKDSDGRSARNLHMHAYPEIFMQISGRREYTCPSGSFNLMPGEICIVPAKTWHIEEFFERNDAPMLTIIVFPFSPSAMRIHLSSLSHGIKKYSHETNYFSNKAGMLISHMNDLCGLYGEGCLDRELELSLLNSALLLILRIMEEASREMSASAEKILQCKAVIASSISDAGLNVGRLASILECSSNYLSHKFHKDTGVRLADYINQQRVELAKDILRSSSHSVKEIAWSCGYNDPGYFTRVFSKNSGMTPNEYRSLANSILPSIRQEGRK